MWRTLPPFLPQTVSWDLIFTLKTACLSMYYYLVNIVNIEFPLQNFIEKLLLKIKLKKHVTKSKNYCRDRTALMENFTVKNSSTVFFMWNLQLQTAEGSRTHDFCMGSTCQTSTRWQVEGRFIYCFIAKTLAARCLCHTYLNVARTKERGSDSHAERPGSWWIEDHSGFHQFGNGCLLSVGCIRSDVAS